ncbi:hypothetical protein [Aneurinibacillus aneurinilyticus]|uniref:Uncharacterized protein n=1 Tax=Aneurinibacillus aneurinilyticus TaxID=1391 RepID=A0A848CX39_ANEAE|nr:hypothetical protein [Aneurinibacillus aneurinilyticus]NMF00036.1 hypothetical protein [Aneurinibacillus aneurinilyticus]
MRDILEIIGVILLVVFVIGGLFCSLALGFSYVTGISFLHSLLIVSIIGVAAIINSRDQ